MEPTCSGCDERMSECLCRDVNKALDDALLARARKGELEQELWKADQAEREALDRLAKAAVTRDQLKRDRLTKASVG